MSVSVTVVVISVIVVVIRSQNVLSLPALASFGKRTAVCQSVKILEVNATQNGANHNNDHNNPNNLGQHFHQI